jgi:hypothetical protein
MSFEETVNNPAPIAQWAAPVANFASLPTPGLYVGETRYTISDATFYFWNGVSWIDLVESGGVDDGVY